MKIIIPFLLIIFTYSFRLPKEDDVSPHHEFNLPQEKEHPLPHINDEVSHFLNKKTKNPSTLQSKTEPVNTIKTNSNLEEENHNVQDLKDVDEIKEYVVTSLKQDPLKFKIRNTMFKFYEEIHCVTTCQEAKKTLKHSLINMKQK